MTILPIIKGDIITLIKKSEEFDFANPPINPSQLAHDLVELMYAEKGIGLAAIQVNIPYRVFALRGTPENFVFFNPRIVMYSNEVVKLEEGCLSFPGLFVEIKRPRDIRIRFEGPTGETFTHTFTGMTARVCQHEMDHLDGLLFYNRANPYKRRLAFNQQAKYLRLMKSQQKAA